jgi:hypothetical protein
MDKPGTSIVFRGDDIGSIDAAFAELEAYCRTNGIESREELNLA